MEKKILIIDDDPAIRKSFILALEGSDYRVATAENGAAGLQKFRKIKFDLVYLDLKMPGLNGVRVLKALREMDKDVPIYIITAFHEEFLNELDDVVEAGLEFELLRKPIGLEQISEITENILNHK